MGIPAKGERTILLARSEGRRGGICHIRTRIVESSNVWWIGWPMSGEPLMIVQYKSGMRYGYLGVSRQRAVAAAYAESVGGYINKRIKPKFDAVKVA